jgi:hypothetical protein
MHQSLARYSAPVSFVHALSLADFITIIVGFKVFGTHNRAVSLAGDMARVSLFRDQLALRNVRIEIAGLAGVLERGFDLRLFSRKCLNIRSRLLDTVATCQAYKHKQ